MIDQLGIGVFTCRCSGDHNHSPGEIEGLEGLDNVVLAREMTNLCSSPSRELFKEELGRGRLTGVVILCAHPLGVEGDLRQLLSRGGLSPMALKMVKRGPGEMVALNRAVLDLLQEKKKDSTEMEVAQRALVIGGGIAGIQAALDIAQAGFSVYLVEKSPSLGGHMAQLDKTFPTLDCSACILTPKMVDVAAHPQVELLTYSQVERVTGHVGSFQVQILKKARYVQLDRCTGCGACAQVCRLKNTIPSEYEAGMGKRGAIYLPFPQAVPSCYTIDASNCLYVTRGKCGQEPACVAHCDREAIDLEAEDEYLILKVGTIVVATGFTPFDAASKVEYAYQDSPQVITGLELERLLSASGPTGGKPVIQTKKGEITPEKVAFIQCVGSRDISLNREYCSRVCCMYTAKQALLLTEKLPGVSVSIYYMDVRAFGKGFEEFYDQVRRRGVHYIRGNPSEVFPRGEELVILAEDTLSGKPLEESYDLVVLAVGMEPTGHQGLAEVLGLSCSPDHFFQERHPQLSPMETTTAGIYLAGTCQAPKDIPDTINQAKAAAAAAMIPLFYQRIRIYSAYGRTFWEAVKKTRTGGLIHGG